jgi:subtilisin
MRATPLRATIGAVSLIAALFAGTAAAPAAGQQSYIVVLDAGTENVAAVAADAARVHNGEVGFVYQHAIKGFSISVNPQGAAALARNPQVAYVEADQPRSIVTQTVLTGIQRIFADDNTNIDIDGSDDFRVDVDVAIIDTGIDFEHPDLSVVGGVDCSGGSPFRSSCSSGGDDDHFHGTHVAGTVAAIDNAEGVVGVAPGARLWAVKVLNSNGSGYVSWIVAGIDWIAAQGNIEVANMSLGGSGFSQAEYDAIQGAVETGVAFAVAAGNSDDDAANYSPAAFDNVLTVSALADFDGEPGGLGSPTCRDDQDDTLADFSNWGSAVQIAAPGVCILSTFPIEDGSYGTISGTSMASPHAAGALALLASSNNPNGAADVHNLYDQVINSGNFNWTDDSGDGIKEPLLDVSNATLFAPVLVAGGGGGGGDTNSPPTASFTFSCTDLSCDFDASGSSDSDGSIASYDWDFGDGNTVSGVTANHTYAASGTYTVVLTVTDDERATDSDSQSVTVSSESTGGETLVGSSENNGSTWTAIVTDTSGGDPLTGTWDYPGTASCADNTCTLSGIPKRQGSVTFTSDGNGGSITISKP